ncbi:hypothetical protein D9M71_811290 [compost metagenome]
MAGQRAGVIDQPGELLVHLFGDAGVEYTDFQGESSGHTVRRGLEPLHDLDQVAKWFHHTAQCADGALT